MGATNKFGKTLGARVDCYNKTKDACFQYPYKDIFFPFLYKFFDYIYVHAQCQATKILYYQIHDK